MTCLHYLVLLLILFEQPVDQGHGQLIIPPVNIVPSCGAHPGVDEILQQIRSNISDILNEFDIQVVPECGYGLWYRVAYLNMTDPSQQCPGAWMEYNTSGVRACSYRRPVSGSENCSATFYSIDQQYSKVCGRVISYQVGTPDGFLQFHNVTNLSRGYIDGVSITYGEPRHHIWSMSLVIVRGILITQWEIVHVLPIEDPCHHHLLTIITTVNLEIQLTRPLYSWSTQVIHSGMVSSVKVPAAVVPSLLHGSVYSCPPTQLIGLRCGFVLMSPLKTKIS